MIICIILDLITLNISSNFPPISYNLPFLRLKSQNFVQKITFYILYCAKILLTLQHEYFFWHRNDTDDEMLTRNDFIALLKDKINNTSIEQVKADVFPFLKSEGDLKLWSNEYFLALSDMILFLWMAYWQFYAIWVNLLHKSTLFYLCFCIFSAYFWTLNYSVN